MGGAMDVVSSKGTKVVITYNKVLLSWYKTNQWYIICYYRIIDECGLLLTGKNCVDCIIVPVYCLREGSDTFWNFNRSMM